MRITGLTITGADDSVGPAELAELSGRYPFVEWGILFSQSRERTPRYPSRKWVAGLCAMARERPMSLSAHLCGKWARDIVERGEPTILKEHGDHWPFFERRQLNVSYHQEPIGEKAHTFLEGEYRDFGRRLIIQTSRQHDTLFQSFLGAPWAVPLFDASGGAGLMPSRWPSPYPGIHCGYAGGLGPENLAAQLGAIQALADGVATAWVDMESKVRSLDDESLDLGKVSKCLEIAAPFILQRAAP